MRLKASCDVESVEDFRKYYQGSYVQGKNGKVYLIREVGTALGGQVLLREASLEGGRMSVLSWEEMRKYIVFGKVPGGMVDVQGQVVYLWEPNNRVSYRGYAPRHIRSHQLGGRIPEEFLNTVDRNGVDMSDVHALCVFNRVFTPIGKYDPTNGKAIALSPWWAVAPDLQTGTHILYRRADPVGHYFPEKRHVVLGPNEYKKFAPSLSYLLGVECHERRG